MFHVILPVWFILIVWWAFNASAILSSWPRPTRPRKSYVFPFSACFCCLSRYGLFMLLVISPGTIYVQVVFISLRWSEIARSLISPWKCWLSKCCRLLWCSLGVILSSIYDSRVCGCFATILVSFWLVILWLIVTFFEPCSIGLLMIPEALISSWFVMIFEFYPIYYPYYNFASNTSTNFIYLIVCY